MKEYILILKGNDVWKSEHKFEAEDSYHAWIEAEKIRKSVQKLTIETLTIHSLIET